MNLAVLALVLLGARDDWPNWRGPNHDGISGETAWGDGGREVWRVAVGRGYSCPDKGQF